MSSSNRSVAPLNRWKSRFWILTKPMFWMSSFLLMFIGLLIVDYYRVSVSPGELEATSIPETQATVDNIPLSDDPELQELRDWEIAQDAYGGGDAAVDLDVADPDAAGSDVVDPDAAAIAPESTNPEAPVTNTPTENTSTENPPTAAENNEGGFGIGSANLALTDGTQAPTEANADETDVQSRRDRPDQGNTALFSDYVSRADDVLERMGLTVATPPPSGTLLSLPTNPDFLPSSSNDSSITGTVTPPQSLPQSFSLRDAIQNLSGNPFSPQPTNSSESENPDETPLEQSVEALTPSFWRDEPNSALAESELDEENTPVITPLLGIQTAPLPGTTGYTPPASAAQFAVPSIPGTVPGRSSISGPSIPATAVPIPPTGIPPTAIIPGTSVAPVQSSLQPTFSVPGQTTPTLPSPVFPPTVEPGEHAPYTGGGRNGRINTFANP